MKSEENKAYDVKSILGKAEAVAAVCTGSMLLGFAGLLDGLHATNHLALARLDA